MISYIYKWFSSIIPLRTLNKITQHHTIFPLYHAVHNNPAPHLKHVLNIRSEQQFKTDLDFLLKYYKPIDLKTIIDKIKKDIPFREPEFLLSFDDGLNEIYEIIAPILKQKGIPAIIFINPAFVDNKDLFYRFKASVLADRVCSGIIESDQAEKICNLFIQNEFREPNNLYFAILSIKYHNKELLDQIADILNIDFQSYLQKHKPYLTMSQLYGLQKQGFSIGAHSMDHPDFNKMDIKEQIRQTNDSVSFIQNHFDEQHASFSMPFTDFGLTKQYFKTIYSNIQNPIECSFGCAGLKNDTFKQHIQRLPVENTKLPLKNYVYQQYMYYLLKAPFGKNTIKRK